MIILSWNCKGLSKPAVVRTLRRLIQDQSLDILFISMKGLLGISPHFYFHHLPLKPPNSFLISQPLLSFPLSLSQTCLISQRPHSFTHALPSEICKKLKLSVPLVSGPLEFGLWETGTWESSSGVGSQQRIQSLNI
jgi:hypothetical protein